MKPLHFFCIFLMLGIAALSWSVEAGNNAAGPERTVATIHSIDFWNFTYHPTLCEKEYGKEGIKKSLRVQPGVSPCS
jgi:hypothetical protein